MVNLLMGDYLKRIIVLGIVLTISMITFAQDVTVKGNTEEVQERNTTTTMGGILRRNAHSSKNAKKGLAFDIYGGMSVSHFSEASEAAKSKIGWNIGIGMKLPLWFSGDELYGLSLRPALMFVSKGAKLEIEESGYKQKTVNNPVYMEIPVKLAFSYELGQINVVPYIGPYFALGVGGKHKTELSAAIGTGTANGKNEGDFFSESYGKSFDFGMTIGGQFEYSNIYFTVGYDIGFSKVLEGAKCKNRALLIGLGWAL